MKHRIQNTLILGLFIATFFNSLSGQEYGDTLYVMAYNGINLREEPSKYGAKIGAIPFGTPVIFCSKSHEERIEIRYGRWIEVEYNGISSYLFDGFITDKKIPTNRKLNLSQISDLIKESYGENITHHGIEESIKKGDRNDEVITHYSTGLKVTHRKNNVLESWEYAFPGLRTRDLINIIDLIYSNYNEDDKTLISHFETDEFWRGRDPDKICPGAFPVKISDKIRIQYDNMRKRSDEVPIPKIYVMKYLN